MRRQRGIRRGVAGADDQDIDLAEFIWCHAPSLSILTSFNLLHTFSYH